jgi:hypothetical protein
MGAILPMHALIVHQAHIGLVYEGGGLERVAPALALHIAVGQAAELFVDGRRQPVEVPSDPHRSRREGAC